MTKLETKPDTNPLPDPLLSEFDQLSSECVAALETELAAAKDISSKLAKAYLLWRKLQQNLTALTTIYERNGLERSDSDGDKPDFTTYVKVLFRVDLQQKSEADQKRHAVYGQVLRNKIGDYAASLRRMHADHTTNPDRYRRLPEANLAAFHREEGGIRGAKKWQSAKNANVKNIASGVATSPEPDTSAVSDKWLKINALGILKKATISTANSVTNPGELEFDTDGVALCIVYDKGNGQLVFIPAANDNDALQCAARSTAGKLRYTQGPALRTLAEVVATQCYPKHFAPTGSRLRITGGFGSWHRDVYLEKGKSGQTAQRCLVVRRDSLLLSASDTDSGLITILRPTQPLLPQDQPDAYLGDLDLRRIECFLDDEITPSFECDPPSLLVARPNSTNCYLMLKSLAGLAPRELDFIDTAQRPKMQVDLHDANFIAEWEFTVTRRWLAKLQGEFFTTWFDTHARGRKLGRDVNLTFKLQVDVNRLRIGYEIDETGSHPSHDAVLGVYGASLATLNGPATDVFVSAKDFAPVMYNLSDLDLVGNVSVGGDAHLVLIKFETQHGRYQIAIPTVTVVAKQLVRNPAHMKQY